MHATMFNTFATDGLNSLQTKTVCTCTVYQLQILVYIFQSIEHSTLQFKMQIHAVCSAADSAVFQFCYLFDFTLFVFSH